MRVAYADPPYLGCCARYAHEHGEGGCWDDLATHHALISRLGDEFPDGWAMSTTSSSLQRILPICPDGVRVSAWVKPFASFKPNVNPAYAWEPVIWRGGRQPRSRDEATVRDWHRSNITMKRGLTGAKPQAFCFWLFDLLGLTETDEFVDLFHGSGAVKSAWQRYSERLPLEAIQ